MHFEPVTIGFKPRPNVMLFVVGRVVLYEDGSTATVAPSDLLKKREVCGRVEDVILPVVKLGAVDLNGSQDLHALTLTCHWDFRRAPNWTPRCVERGVLAEACFVREDERPIFAMGFFFRIGYVRLCHRSC